MLTQIYQGWPVAPNLIQLDQDYMYHNPLCQRTVTTIRSLLVKTRPATEEHNKKGVIYRVPHQVSKVYTGEMGCKFDTRLYEHKQHYRLIQTQKPSTAEHAINEDYHSL